MALGAITKTNGICKKPQEEIGQEQLQREETDPHQVLHRLKAGLPGQQQEQLCYQ